MSSVPITDVDSATRKIDTIQRLDGAETVETQAVAIIDPATGNAAKPDVNGAMPVLIQPGQTNVPVVTSAASASGTLGALNDALVLDVTGMACVAIDVRAGFSGTISIQGSIDGTTYFTLNAASAGSAVGFSTVSTVVSSAAMLVAQCAGLRRVRLIVTAYTSGSTVATMNATTASTLTFAMLSAGPSTASIGNVGTHYQSNSTGAATTGSVLSPATPVATQLKGSAGRVVGMALHNSSAQLRSVKFWNSLAAGVTLGTTAAMFEIDIPAGGLLTFDMPGGVAFGTAITYAVTGGKGLTDNTAVSLNDVTGAIFYS